ncbi:unnamed protein product [Larinioides sclopetarius]|uniref:RRM domain-containing protein n=1 Tax=Larinioides sclopetarius TaxID=280406 RepID=A0AAV2AIN9_9ARAC
MDDKERVLYCGNLSERVTEDILYELFLQAGPLESVKIPKEKDGRQRNYGFITFKHAVSVPYSIALMDGLSLFGKSLHLNARSGSEAAPNPYKEQLRQYEISINEPSYHQSDNWKHDYYSRRPDSRRVFFCIMTSSILVLRDKTNTECSDASAF